MKPNEAPMEGAMAVLTTPATEVADDLVTLADGLADASARFVQTAEAVAAGRLLDIAVLDHLVIGHGAWTSLRDRGVAFDRS